MSVEALLSYGMKRIGVVHLNDARFNVTLTIPNAGEFERCIYAFVVGGEILRIGSSKGKLKTRLNA
jgi:hypothetical protein